MKIQEAIIIKTKSDKDTEMAKRTREVYQDKGQDVVLVPYGLTELFITIQENEDNNILVVNLIKTNDGYNPVDLDVATGFDSVAECWEYARLVAMEAGLSEDCIDNDVWDIPAEVTNE